MKNVTVFQGLHFLRLYMCSGWWILTDCLTDEIDRISDGGPNGRKSYLRTSHWRNEIAHRLSVGKVKKLSERRFFGLVECQQREGALELAEDALILFSVLGKLLLGKFQRLLCVLLAYQLDQMLLLKTGSKASINSCERFFASVADATKRSEPANENTGICRYRKVPGKACWLARWRPGSGRLGLPPGPLSCRRDYQDLPPVVFQTPSWIFQQPLWSPLKKKIHKYIFITNGSNDSAKGRNSD